MSSRIQRAGVLPGVAVVVALVLSSQAAGQESVVTAVPETAFVDGAFTPAEIARILSLSPLGEMPNDETNAIADDPRAAHLGQFLFFDERLSANGKVSCASCHRPDHGFSTPDRLGHGLSRTTRHPPSLLNVAYHRWFDWDGKADSLWAQAVRPLESPDELGFTRTQLARLIYNDPSLRKAYEAIFGPMPDLSDEARFARKACPFPENPTVPWHQTWLAVPEHPLHQAWLTMQPRDREVINRILTNVTKSIAAYESRLISSDATFDRYVEGLRERNPEKLAAISPAAKGGLKLFIGTAQCIVCHNGPNFTDMTFHNIGLGIRSWLVERDEGRYYGVAYVKKSPFSALGDYSDDPRGKRAQWSSFLIRTHDTPSQFKTPSLRGVALTPPYMHGGHFDTLEDVVRFYSELDESPAIGVRESTLQPRGLSDEEIHELVQFLKTLTGRPVDPALTQKPGSPSYE
ncbi:MAG: cytochrome-c peroxidase [Gammaproteobacteria bacterium]